MARRVDLYGTTPEPREPESSAHRHRLWSWQRTVTMLVACACTIGGYWWQTHPSATRVVTVHVTQGDGYMSEADCYSLRAEQQRGAVQAKFGVPANWDATFDNNDVWWYPLREGHGRYCSVNWQTSQDASRANDPVTDVSLDLVRTN